MNIKFNRIFLLSMIVTIIFAGNAHAFWGKNKNNKDKPEEKTSQTHDENKLMQLDSLEDAFLKRVRHRKVLAVTVLNLQDKLKRTDNEKEKKALIDQIEKSQKDLEILNVAMDVIFSPSQPRQYEYNPVKSAVYLKVGNLEQMFIRAVQVRDALLKAIQEQQKKLDEAKKDDEKKDIQGGIANLQRQYQTLVASLQVVFDIVPQRNYSYNPKDSTLYLRVTENEAKKIQEKINEMSKQQKTRETQKDAN